MPIISKCPYCGEILSCEQPEGTEVDCATCGQTFVSKEVDPPRGAPDAPDKRVLRLKHSENRNPHARNAQEHARFHCRICGRALPLPYPYPESVVCTCGHLNLIGPPALPFYSRARFRFFSLAALGCIVVFCAFIGGFHLKGRTRQEATRMPELHAITPAQESANPTVQAQATDLEEKPRVADTLSEQAVAPRNSPTASSGGIENGEDSSPSQRLAEVAPWIIHDEVDAGAPMAADAPPAEAFDAIAPSAAPPLQTMVAIETDMGRGTGFIVEHDGKKYILTNQHVLEALRQMTFTLFDGTVLRPRMIEINKSSDLARVDISGTPHPALLLDPVLPNIGDGISVYGDGGGEIVFTKLSGMILGVGPDKLEISTELIPGNSGSPIVSSRGRVLGVATYVLTRTDASDYLLTGTRFAKPRRFGLRYDPQATWVRVSTPEFIRQQGVLDEVEKYLINVLSVMFCWLGDPALQEKAQAYFESTVTHPLTRHYYDTKWTEHISIFADRYGTYWRDRFRLHTDDGRLNRTQVMLGTILVGLAQQPSMKLNREIWASDALRDRAKYLEECMALFTKECTAITKRAGWDKCVIEDALKRNRRPDKDRETPTFPFLYDQPTE